MTDARLSYDPPDSSWVVSIWAMNLTDELYRTSVIPFFGEEVGQ